jgi:hypothetical protein
MVPPPVRPGPGRLGVVHVHSTWSHDGRDTLEALHDFAKVRGITFVGLTDHAEDFDAARFSAYTIACQAASSAAVTLIPGLEFRFAGHKGLHLLALGLSQWISPATPSEFITLAGSAARFTIAAHPILYRYDLPATVAAGIDAIEIWNATYNTRWLPDPRAISLLRRVRSQRPEVTGIAGLDQHDSRNDRQTRVLLLRADPALDPLTELKQGRYVNLGRTMTLQPSEPLGPTALGMLHLLRWGFDRVERTQDALVRLARGSRK